MKKHLEVLKHIATELNNADIDWALGASMLLYLKGMDVTVDDLDIIVDEKDTEKLFELLKKYKYIYMESNPKYQTKHFISLEIDGIDLDIMIDFRVKTKKGLYIYPFKIDEVLVIDSVKINLCSIDEWLNAYIAMGRDKKIEMIQKYKSSN